MPELPRRSDDDRLDQLVSQLTSLVSTVAVVANDIGYLKAQRDANAANISLALEKLNAISSDASASPAGRDLLRRLKEIEREQEEDHEALETVKLFTVELRSGFKVLRGMTVAVSLFGTTASGLWLFHGLHWFGF